MSGRERPRSRELFERANVYLPGGVNSPVRAFKSVGGDPPFIAGASGSTIRDVDGNEYIDYVMSYGPLLFGHSPGPVVEALREAAGNGTVYGAPTEAEAEMAELVCGMVPSVEMVRFVNSGSEATTSAIRLARGFTGRNKIVKCAGCFHGSVDSLLVAAGSGVATLGIPETAGIPLTFAAETIVLEYNDAEALTKVFKQHGHEIAGFILEPVAANMGVVLPAAGYLELARELTTKHGALLIFDEVITGFRLGEAGAQGHYRVTPDLTCFGKIVGGGVPCGAYGGRRDIMEHLAPLGPVYQAGTLSGNPLAMRAGLATLKMIREQGEALYQRLDRAGQLLADGILQVFNKQGVPCRVQRHGSVLTAFFSENPVTNYAQAKQADVAAFAKFFHKLLNAGVYVAPSQFEGWFLSTAHSDDDIARTLAAIEKSLV